MIINLTHQKGGVGKSTLTTNLSVELDATIIDLDSLRSSVLWNKIRVNNGKQSINCFTVSDENEMKQVINENVNKNIIIDSGGYDSGLTRLAILMSDVILTPVSPSQIELFGLQNFATVIQEISNEVGEKIQTNVIINNADTRSKSSIQYLQEFVTENNEYFNLLDTVIHARADFKKAYGEGLSVSELDSKGKAADEIKQLVKEIMG
jgi:chromosome partitioning protein